MLQMMMVGTGSAFAKKYFNNSAILMSPEYTLLIDCGATVPLALHTLGEEYGEDLLGKIDGVLISHAHGDHINGLEEVAFQMMYKYKKKIDLIAPSEVLRDLWPDSLKGGLHKTNEGLKFLHDYFNLGYISDQTCMRYAGDIKIETVKTNHIVNKPTYGFVFNDKLWYSGDAKFDGEKIERIAKSVEWIFHDCQLQGFGNDVHATLDELIQLPIDIRNKMWLMHYGDNMEDFRAKAEEATFTFAEQGKVYPIG